MRCPARVPDARLPRREDVRAGWEAATSCAASIRSEACRMSGEIFSQNNSDTVKIRPAAPNALEARSQKRDLLAEQNQDWAEDHPHPPEHYLERWPVDAKADPDGASVLVAKIFQRRQRGEHPSLDEYEQRFPEHG